jgi:SM-20-related protein
MPPPSFFRSLGLFIRHDFLDPGTCARILDEMQTSVEEKALVVRNDSQTDFLDESRRRALIVRIPKPTRALIHDQLFALKASLEQHFGVALAEVEQVDFLRYLVGSFYKPHFDANVDSHPATIQRRVSVVIFLNSRGPADDCYWGGALTFHGILPGPQWEQCAFCLDAEPGLLVAFRSDLLHEVQPVTSGQRFTIVSWFLA